MTTGETKPIKLTLAQAWVLLSLVTEEKMKEYLKGNKGGYYIELDEMSNKLTQLVRTLKREELLND